MFRNALVICLLASASPLVAQQHAHTPGMTHPSTAADLAANPVSPGQAAYGAIREVVRLLDQDSTTNWPTVNIERLRQHLIDMDVVIMQSTVRQENIPDGVRLIVTGTDRTVDAIRRTTTAHGAMLRADGLGVTIHEIPSGVRMMVTASPSHGARGVARLRGLGFIGLMTTGDHHGPHHLTMAKGTLHGH